jgi:hypothetical protein
MVIAIRKNLSPDQRIVSIVLFDCRLAALFCVLGFSVVLAVDRSCIVVSQGARSI